MRILHYWKLLAILLIATGFLAACGDRDAVPAAGMVNSKDGTPIRYQSQGEGNTAIVFVHCWTCDHSFWNAQYSAFADRYKVVRLDLAGHGTSAGRKHYNIAGYADDVAAVANILQLQRMVLVGHSMGGPVVAEAEKQLGNRVIGVVGVDTFYTPFTYPGNEEEISNFVRPFEENFNEAREGLMRSMFPGSADPGLVDKVARAIPESSRDMAIQSMYAIFRWGLREGPATLDALGGKLHNINGDPLDKGERLHDSVMLIPGAGHFPHMEKPAEFNKALQDILNGLEGRR